MGRLSNSTISFPDFFWPDLGSAPQAVVPAGASSRGGSRLEAEVVVLGPAKLGRQLLFTSRPFCRFVVAADTATSSGRSSQLRFLCWRCPVTYLWGDADISHSEVVLSEMMRAPL